MTVIPVLLANDHVLVRAAICAVLVLALISPGAVARGADETAHTIRVVVDNAYAPYSFRSDEGKLQGILIDQWQAWEKKTGIKVEIHALDWGEALRRMRAGEFDVIDSIVETPERRDYFDFTRAYTPVEASIYFRKDISGIADLASLQGFPVGVKAGDQHIDKLKANGVATVIVFQNNDRVIEAAEQHKISVFVVDDPSALYLLNKMGIEEEFRHSAPIFRDELRRAVRKADAAMLRTVSEGFAAIEPAELQQINEKWFGRTINWYWRYLIYAGYAVGAAFLIIAGLTVWNRTLRKKILQRTGALSESEQRFRRLVELMPVAVYVCDTDGIIQIYNQRAVELWGREPKSGGTAQRYCASLRLWSPDGNLVPHEKSKMAEVLRTGVEARNLEVVIERPDESCITVLVNIAPLRNIKGELMGAMNCFQDITQRKQAQEALRESETRFRQVAENISEVFWLANPEATLIHYVSPAYAKIWGRSCDSLYAEPSSWMDSIHPDDRERIAKGVRLQLVRGQHDHTYRIVRPDGSHRWIRDRAFPVSDESGKLIRVAGLAEDITERKEAEDRLREYEKVVEGLEEMIVVVDRDYRYLLANRAFLKYRGMEREQLVGRLVAEVLNEAVFENVTKRKLDECLHGEPVQYEMTYRYPDRGERDLLISYFPIEGPAGVDRVACVLQDITERNRAAKELEEANHRLRILSRRLFEVQEQERRHLARELHDEIGQTLTAAKLNLKIIAPDVPPAFARRLEDSTQLLDRLLMQVRQLSLDLRPPMLDELGLVPTLRWLVDQQAQRAGLRVTFTANVERMEMDPLTRTACFRLAQEAITNAIRHAQAATVAVELRAEPHRLWLVVHDDGVGFDKDAMQQRAARGGSIGLLSMNERVSLLGGEMEVSSAPGRGTEIRAWFPTAPPGPSFATEPL